jgi:ribosomal protein S9
MGQDGASREPVARGSDVIDLAKAAVTGGGPMGQDGASREPVARGSDVIDLAKAAVAGGGPMGQDDASREPVARGSDVIDLAKATVAGGGPMGQDDASREPVSQGGGKLRALMLKSTCCDGSLDVEGIITKAAPRRRSGQGGLRGELRQMAREVAVIDGMVSMVSEDIDTAQKFAFAAEAGAAFDMVFPKEIIERIDL